MRLSLSSAPVLLRSIGLLQQEAETLTQEMQTLFKNLFNPKNAFSRGMDD